MSSTDKIEKQVTLRAPVSRVWRAIADASEFGRWFGFTLEGDFAQIFDVLERLESRPHRVWISNLTLSQPAEDGKTLRAEMTLTIFADLAENSEPAKSA